MHRLLLQHLLVGIICLLASAVPTWAATFTINSIADAVDENPGDGVCATSLTTCTLRAAIQEANALAGADTITLPAGTYTLSLEGAEEDAAATGDLDINDDLTINGAGAASTIIDGGALDRVFDIDPADADTNVEITGVTIQNGSGTTIGGGVFNAGTLTITNSTISGNTASDDGAAASKTSAAP